MRRPARTRCTHAFPYTLHSAYDVGRRVTTSSHPTLSLPPLSAHDAPAAGARIGGNDRNFVCRMTGDPTHFSEDWEIVERVEADTAKIPDFVHNTCIVAENGEDDNNKIDQASTSASECEGERVHDLRIGVPPVLCAVLREEREQLNAQTWRDDSGCYYSYKLRPDINLAFWCMELWLLNGIVVRFRLSLEHKCFVQDSTYVVKDDGSRHLHASFYDSFHLEFHPNSILNVGGRRVEVAGTSSLLHKTNVRSTESTYVILCSKDALPGRHRIQA